ncbi:endonuclease [Tenacibaculum sp. TC6]|uniref:endonuclease n=1 Tax=Tenacibaculum sp. TC6 TaxID=3423223 RepID=UPI003D366B17
MKKLLFFIVTLTSLWIYSQVPSYYNDVNINLAGSDLKDALSVKIISTHTTVLTYTPDVWNALKQTDISPSDNTKVVLIYGWDDTDTDITNDLTRDKDNHGSGSGVWNREHVYAKSLANPDLGTTGPGADAHNLRPADSQRNSTRNNRKFAAGSGIASYITPEGYWYPGDEWKGDVARMIMYMYLRYGNQTLPINVGVGTTVATDPNMIDVFLQWNAEDPVSDIEKQRNPVLEQMQGNRNPFIDNPAFATKIWGGPQAQDLFGNGGNTDTQAPTAPSNLVSANITQTTVDLAWTASTDNTAVSGYIIFNGSTQIASSSTNNVTVTNLLAGTTYSFSVKAYDAAGNYSQSSNTIQVTTTSENGGGNGTASELLISEYVEGSSYNKALEIANFTGSTIDLSNYSIKKSTNGGGTWSSTLALSGSLSNGNVYVIAHGSATQEILNKANITDNSVMTFNGNDAVALFKNNTLIDLLGNPSSSATFAQDVTLQRKPSVTAPNTTYNTSEWTNLATDTFTGLGAHSINGTAIDTTAPSAPSDLVVANITHTSADLAWTASTDNIAVTGYEVYQNNTKIATVTTTSYSVTGLTSATNYTFFVKALDGAGNISASSNTIGVTTKSDTSNTTTVLSLSYFESGWDNWVDGGSDCARYSGSLSYEGDFSIRLRDNSGVASSMTSPSYDITSYDTVEVEFYFYSYSMENGEDFWLRYFDGTTWKTIATYVSGTDFQNTNFYTATVTIHKSEYNFVNNAQFRFQNDASDNADQIFIDQVTITGKTTSGSAKNTNTDNTITLLHHYDSGLDTLETDFKAYPNPVSGSILNIQLQSNTTDTDTISYRITTLLGQVVSQGNMTSNYIEVAQLKAGIYLLEINDGEEKMVQKFVKK